MSLIKDAKNVSTAAPEADPNATLLIDRKRPKRLRSLTVIIPIALAIVVAGVYVTSCNGGPSKSSAAENVEAKAAPPEGASPKAAACQGDLSQAGPQLQWYCHEFMPWKQAVDQKLDNRASGGTPSWMRILIGMLVANSLVTWILLLRRKKPS